MKKIMVCLKIYRMVCILWFHDTVFIDSVCISIFSSQILSVNCLWISTIVQLLRTHGPGCKSDILDAPTNSLLDKASWTSILDPNHKTMKCQPWNSDQDFYTVIYNVCMSVSKMLRLYHDTLIISHTFYSVFKSKNNSNKTKKSKHKNCC